MYRSIAKNAGIKVNIIVAVSINGTFDITSGGISPSSFFLSMRINKNITTANKIISEIVL